MTDAPEAQETADEVARAVERGDAVDGLTRSLALMRGHIETIQRGKRQGGSVRPITNCINDLPKIVQWIESALFEIEAEFEKYEDRLAVLEEERRLDGEALGLIARAEVEEFDSDLQQKIIVSMSEDEFVDTARARLQARKDHA